MTITKNWRAVLAQATSPADGGGSFTVTRAAGNQGEMVFLEEDGHDVIWMTREQAADLGQNLLDVSGMATSSSHARYLAEVVNDSLFRKGVTKARVCAEAGITRYRLRRILSATAPMTNDELEAISAVGSEHSAAWS
jgi:hypothetical protein